MANIAALLLLVLAAGAAAVDFYHRRAWIAIAVGLIAIALAIPVGQSL